MSGLSVTAVSGRVASALERAAHLRARVDENPYLTDQIDAAVGLLVEAGRELHLCDPASDFASLRALTLFAEAVGTLDSTEGDCL